MTDLEAFETLWAIKGHAEAITEGVKLEGVSDSKLVILKDTIDRMSELMKKCYEYRNLK